jgi:hypothetical protein
MNKFIPILFSTEMVKAILSGSKVQTRRVVNPQPPADYDYLGTDTDRSSGESIFYACWEGHEFHNVKCPYGQVDDILWVRESYSEAYTFEGEFARYLYKTDNIESLENWKPGIFMTKQACRLFLKIKDIRVERLHEISRGDAMAEGCPFPNIAKETYPTIWFQSLWKSISGEASWNDNPWVWVIEFERIEKPDNFL